MSYAVKKPKNDPNRFGSNNTGGSQFGQDSGSGAADPLLLVNSEHIK